MRTSKFAHLVDEFTSSAFKNAPTKSSFIRRVYRTVCNLVWWYTRKNQEEVVAKMIYSLKNVESCGLETWAYSAVWESHSAWELGTHYPHECEGSGDDQLIRIDLSSAHRNRSQHQIELQVENFSCEHKTSIVAENSSLSWKGIQQICTVYTTKIAERDQSTRQSTWQSAW